MTSVHSGGRFSANRTSNQNYDPLRDQKKLLCFDFELVVWICLWLVKFRNRLLVTFDPCSKTPFDHLSKLPFSVRIHLTERLDICRSINQYALFCNVSVIILMCAIILQNVGELSQWKSTIFRNFFGILPEFSGMPGTCWKSMYLTELSWLQVLNILMVQ